MYETTVQPFNSFFAIFTSGCWVAMPFMQCVTEESDEQKPFVLDLNGGLILETVNKYCLLHYSGKIFRIFLLAISKRTSRLGRTFQNLFAFFINNSWIYLIWSLALAMCPNWLLEISCIWPSDWPKTKTTIQNITQPLLQQRNLFHITQSLLRLQTQCNGDKHWRSLDTNPCWSV